MLNALAVVFVTFAGPRKPAAGPPRHPRRSTAAGARRNRRALGPTDARSVFGSIPARSVIGELR